MTPHISTTLLRTQTDERLARLAAEGHERAFEAIVDRYRRPLTRFAQRFVGEARAEEVVQTAFLNAWNSLQAGTEVRDLKPWLYRIVNNGAINAMQRSEYGDAPLIEASDFRLGPEAAYEQSEELRLTVEGIGELPERQREALLAVAVDGRAHADVARDLGVSDAGVRQLVRRARVQLRAAATAITPIPLAVWIAKGGLTGGTTAAGGAAAGSTAAAAGSTAMGGAAMGGAIKAGAIVIGAAVVATGGTEVVRKVEGSPNAGTTAKVASADPRERMLIPGADAMPMGSGRVQATVRMVTGPDGRQHVVVETSPAPPGGQRGSYNAGQPQPMPIQPSQPGQPRQVAEVFSPAMPVSPGGGSGGGGGGSRGGSQAGGAPQQVAEAPTPGGGSPGGSKDDSSRGTKPDKPSTPPSAPSAKPDKPSTTPSAPAEKPDRPSTSPSAPAEKPDRPSTTPSAPSAKPDKPSSPSPAGGGSEKGGGAGKSGDAPSPSGSSGPGPSGGSGKGGSGGRGKGDD